MKKLYDVKLVVIGKAHFYDVTLSDGQTYQYPGVTGHLDIIGGSKTRMLMGWAKKESLRLVKSALTDQMNSDVKITPDWIDDLIKRARKRPDKIKDDAADLGTRVHAFIDLIIHDKEPTDVPPDLLVPVNAFKAWWKNSGIELILGDTKIASLIYQFGGSLDALGRRHGKYILLDWKTSNSIHPEYALQVSAYAQGFAETYGLFIQEAIVCRFGKELPIDFETKTIRDLDQSFRAFLAAKELNELMRFDHFENKIGEQK